MLGVIGTHAAWPASASDSCGAYVLDQALRRFLIPDHLGNPIALAIVIVGFVLSNEVQEEAGLLTVTVMGIWLARRDSAAVRQLLEFNESLRTLLISALFILLAARIEPDQLRDVAVPSLLFLALLVFVARPLAVIVSTLRTALSWRERTFLMVMAPRGIVAAAVSAIFALRLEEEGHPRGRVDRADRVPRDHRHDPRVRIPCRTDRHDASAWPRPAPTVC